MTYVYEKQKLQVTVRHSIVNSIHDFQSEN